MSKQYNQYLQEHKANVAKAFYWLQTNTPYLLVDDYERQITADHDTSKSDTEEYGAYDTYFYGNDETDEVKLQFNKAWLHHIHKNPHHWQHWILINDNPDEGEIILDIPYNFIVEMICDWWAFSFKQNKLDEIFKWYDDHKSYMKLSDNTRRLVEYILSEIKKVLAKMEDVK